MIVLMSPVFNADGNIHVKPLPDSNLDGVSRRVSRRATIDGGVWVDDFGYSDGDRTLSIKSNMDREDYARVKDFVQRYGELVLINDDGVFTGSIESLDSYPTVEITFLMKERING